MLAVHLDILIALMAEKPLYIRRMPPGASRRLRIMIKLFVPQPRRAVIAHNGFKPLEVAEGRLTQSAGRRAHRRRTRGNGGVDGNVFGDIQQMLARVVRIALAPVLDPLIHLLQHFTDGHCKHQITQYRNKQRRDIDQHQASRFIELPTLLALFLIQNPRGHCQYLRIGKHVFELNPG